ncbi:HOOK domain-containing protein [Caenorhabditis elegans]|uniref:HOOK domain-containing protein n=1 Tax=Caenorhabditis elegans TaxID=6239 RepID=H2FLI6_CAEEL|nr:HOOK domain-containing protein [Caenorhabditis elegans]CCF23392.1 HOOK domain-containing protein [Caenorhabditis elegans]|eukprot:NP_001251080.1 Uncharacterized protein CELE_C17E4.20 [Caenorhabditis elegans]
MEFCSSGRLPSFVDVLRILKDIPDQNDRARVEMWATDKYQKEDVLEEKLERFTKLLVNKKFNEKTKAAKINPQSKEIEKRDVEIARLEDELRVTKMESGKDMAALLRDFEKFAISDKESKRMVEGCKKKIEELEEQNRFLTVEITKLLDEKEAMLNEAMEDDEDESSDDSDMSYEDEEDDSEDEDDHSKLNLDADSVVKTMQDMMKLLIESEKKFSMVTKQLSMVQQNRESLNEKLTVARENVKSEAAMKSHLEQKYKRLTLKMKNLEAAMTLKLELESLKVFEETKKVNNLEETLNEIVNEHLQIQENHRAANAQINKLVDENSQIVHKLEQIVAKNINLEKKSAELNEKMSALNKINIELMTSERLQCEKRLIVQDKLVSQMEKNSELQDEVKSLNLRIENLGVEELEDVGEDPSVEQIQESASAEDHETRSESSTSSTSSFEPIDDDFSWYY